MTKPISEYWPNGEVKHEILFDEHGRKSTEIFYNENGECDRDPLEGPALITYDEHEQLEEEYWFNGKRHNPYGPAYNDYDDDVFEWHLNDKEYTNEVNEYFDKHGLKYQDMDHIDFDIMWTCIL